MTATDSVRERPILFSGPMVRAILDGRKTQTRRVVKPQPIKGNDEVGPFTWWNGGNGPRAAASAGFKDVAGFQLDMAQYCPYGQPSDRLWVRETFAEIQKGFRYRADFHEHADTRLRFKPSIHMPRRASRLTLEITDVRVERIRDVTDADSQAEGSEACGHHETHGGQRHRCTFRHRWNALNAKRGFGWDANPWVWVLTFTRVTP